jgi:hypothetical protein
LTLYLIADPDAHSTANAEVHVESNKMRIVVHGKISCFPVKRELFYFVFMNELLEFAVTRGVAAWAQQGVRPQEEHELHATALDQFGRLCRDYHAVSGRVKAGRHAPRATALGYFHHAEAACSIRNEPFVVAQGWNLHTSFLSGL